MEDVGGESPAREGQKPLDGSMASTLHPPDSNPKFIIVKHPKEIFPFLDR